MQSSSVQPRRIIVLGGGFGGVYTAMYLDRLLRKRSDVEVVLINRDNYFVFQPLLPEVVSGNIGILDTVSPIRRLLPRCRHFVRSVRSIDLAQRVIYLDPGFRPKVDAVPFDHLVIALGNVTDFRGIPGLQEHALPFKNLADAIRLRNHLLRVMQEAVVTQDESLRKQLLTFVVAGGGFSGVEVVAEMNDFLRRICRQYATISPTELRVVLVHSGQRILERELKERLGLYAQRILTRRGVELLLERRLRTATPEAAILDDQTNIRTKTLVSTVPSSPNPLIELLPVPNDRGKILVDQYLSVLDHANLWALGDCSAVPFPDGGVCPPTAQHAIRQAKVLADNIVARIDGRPLKPYRFRGLGKMGAVGRHSAVAELFGRVRISGVLAWLMWRTIYWSKLPGLDRKIKVGLSWMLDLLIPPETVQLRLDSEKAISQLHFEPGEFVLRESDFGDALYIVLEGEVEVLANRDGAQCAVATMGPGEFFGEISILGNSDRTASVRCTTPTTLLALERNVFQSLVSSLPDLRRSIETVMQSRMAGK